MEFTLALEFTFSSQPRRIIAYITSTFNLNSVLKVLIQSSDDLFLSLVRPSYHNTILIKYIQHYNFTAPQVILLPLFPFFKVVNLFSQKF